MVRSILGEPPYRNHLSLLLPSSTPIASVASIAAASVDPAVHHAEISFP